MCIRDRLATISPTEASRTQTVLTLKYATRSRAITNCPVKEEVPLALDLKQQLETSLEAARREGRSQHSDTLQKELQTVQGKIYQYHARPRSTHRMRVDTNERQSSQRRSGTVSSFSMPTSPKASTSLPSAVTRLVNVIEQALCNQLLDTEWCHIGIALNFGAYVQVNDILYSKRECFTEALQINSKCIVAWLNLLDVLPANDTVTVSGLVHNKKACCLVAIELLKKKVTISNPISATVIVWCSLGNAVLHHGENAVTNSNPKAKEEHTPKACYLSAITHRKICPAAWNNLANTLSDLSLIHISEPTRLLSISYAVFCLKKKKTDPIHSRTSTSKT
eukprot:TRINITY_DN21513_c0_g1_i1.p1 TRINITY_DN21513_c0_g1~~TRINITY_DN21513_c0_g1_i1.p1  ORF type:complete len:336 (+),score=22.00 TRINITY_DN21513_c0_g1_i1:172-1179(+)